MSIFVNLTDRSRFQTAVSDLGNGRYTSITVQLPPDDQRWILRLNNGQWQVETSLPILVSLERMAVQIVMLQAQSSLNVKLDLKEWKLFVRSALSYQATTSLEEWIEKTASIVREIALIQDHPCLPSEMIEPFKQGHLARAKLLMKEAPPQKGLAGLVNPNKVIRQLSSTGWPEEVITGLLKRYAEGSVSPAMHGRLGQLIAESLSLVPLGARRLDAKAEGWVRDFCNLHGHDFGMIDLEGKVRQGRYAVREFLGRYQIPWQMADPTILTLGEGRRDPIVRLGWMLVCVSWGESWFLDHYIGLLESHGTPESLEQDINELRDLVAPVFRDMGDALEMESSTHPHPSWKNLCLRISMWPNDCKDVLWSWIRILAKPEDGEDGRLTIPEMMRQWATIQVSYGSYEVWNLSFWPSNPTGDLTLTREGLLPSSKKPKSPRMKRGDASKGSPSLPDTTTEITASAQVTTKLAPPAEKVITSFGTGDVHPAQAFADALGEEVRGQRHACQSMAFQLHAHRIGRSRGAMLMHGPTGAGKSFMISTAARLAGDLPVVHVNAPSIVPDGIRGLNPSGILLQLFRSAGMKIDTAERGILVFDEFDKVVMGKGHREYGDALMVSLLRIIDGCEWPFGSHEDHLPIKSISTSKMLVILAGAWHQGDASEQALGFTASAAAAKVGHRDLIVDLGLTPELAGRIGGVAVLAPHTKASLMEILDQSKASPWLSINHLTGMEFKIDPSASEVLAELALRRGLGARFLTTACHRLAEVLAFMPKSELPSEITGTWLQQYMMPQLQAA